MTPPRKTTKTSAPKKPAGKRAAKASGKAAKPDLLAVRAQIDGIDREIQSLIAERALFAHQVGTAKGKLAAAGEYYRPELAEQVLGRGVDRNEGTMPDEVLVGLYKDLLSAWLCPQGRL